MSGDPFAVLGVSSSATEDEIKAAYRKLAKKYHPDLNPGDKVAEQKMREVNEAYTRALQIKKTGRDPSAGAYGPSGGYGNTGYGYGPYGNQGSSGGYNSYGGQGGAGGYGSYGRQGGTGGYGSYGSQGGSGGNPFGDFGFDPFSAFFGGAGTQQGAGSGFRPRSYANPELKTVENHVLASRFNEAVNLLNRIPTHDADWHALYARADLGMGNRSSALDHAQAAARMAPGDADYQRLLNSIQAGRETYRQTRQNRGYDFRSALCANPCLTCFAANMLLNCCLGGCGRYGFWC